MNPLAEIIRREIALSGPMPFARFMELALYHPEFGYYERERNTLQIGVAGDYMTSVSVGPLFGGMLAVTFASLLQEIERRNAECGLAGSLAPLQVVEAGAHDCRLARDILRTFRNNYRDVADRVEYVIIEPSPRRREVQEAVINVLLPTEAKRVRWLDCIPGGSAASRSTTRQERFTGVFFCNELLDAFPVHRIGWDAQQRAWFEWGVEWHGDKFNWTRLPLAADSPLLTPHPSILTPELQRVLPNNYTLDLCPAATAWWRDAAQSLAKGWLCTFDYGFTAEARIRPERPDGRVRSFYRHHAHLDILARPGEQDLTSDVDFSLLQAVGEQCGLVTDRMETQGTFLSRVLAINPCLKGTVEEHRSEFQVLTHPDHMGNAFKVLAQRQPGGKVR